MSRGASGFSARTVDVQADGPCRPSFLSATGRWRRRYGRCPRFSPLRKTVTRSEISKTSCSLWVMITMDLPSSRMLFRMRNSLSASWTVRTAVGSSRMRIICAPVQHLDDFHRLLFRDGHVVRFFLSGLMEKPYLSASFRTWRRCSPVQPALFPKAQDDVFGGGQIVHQLEMLGAPCRCRVRWHPWGSGLETSLPAQQNLAVVGEINTGQDVHQSRLPLPFSPSRDGPRRGKRTG